MKKKYYTWNDVSTAADSIMMRMYKDQWLPDCVVGITRGGLPLALLMSHRIDVPMYTVAVQLKDNCTESNCWLSEMAIGYVPEEERSLYKSRWDISNRKNILIIDDINDSGNTLNWIKTDWQSSCFPKEDTAWQSVWGSNVRFAVMTQNWSSGFNHVDYWWDEVNTEDESVCLVYPWERDGWMKKDE